MNCKMSLDKKILIQRLSEMHINNSIDPGILCMATSVDFDKNHRYYQERVELQEALGEICSN